MPLLPWHPQDSVSPSSRTQEGSKDNATPWTDSSLLQFLNDRIPKSMDSSPRYLRERRTCVPLQRAHRPRNCHKDPDSDIPPLFVPVVLAAAIAALRHTSPYHSRLTYEESALCCIGDRGNLYPRPGHYRLHALQRSHGNFTFRSDGKHRNMRLSPCSFHGLLD